MVWRNRDEASIRNELGRELACSEYIDEQIGRVLKRLEEVDPGWSEARLARISIPKPLAAALDLSAGELMQWQLLARSDERLRRLAAPHTSPEAQT